MKSLLIGILIWVVSDILEASNKNIDVKDILLFYYVVNGIYLEKIITYYKDKLKNKNKQDKGDDTS